MTNLDDTTKNQMHLEQRDVYTKTDFDEDLWKMKIEIISSMKDTELQKKNEKIIEMRKLQDKVNKKRIENCDYLHNLIENSWVLKSEGNFQKLFQNRDMEKSKLDTNSVLCNKVESDIKTMNLILEGLNFKKQQENKLIELNKKLCDVKRSVIVWNNKLTSIQNAKSK